MLIAGSAGAAEQRSAARPVTGKPAVPGTGQLRRGGAAGSAKPAAGMRNPSAQQAVLAKVRARQAAIERARVPHLDPALNAVAGLVGPGGDPGVRLSRHGTVEVTVTGSGAAAAARAVGGKVVAGFGGSTVIAVLPTRLAALAAQPAVGEVTQTVQATPQVTSEGVHSAGADAWQGAAGLGDGGTGVNVGIVDAGFANLAAEIAAGHLDAAQVHYLTGSAQDKCLDDSTTDHGTAVTEIVHQMAPNAALYLYCVDNNIGFSQVASEIVAAGDIKVVNSSLSFTGESRGDGNGGVGTTEQAVKAARQAGVLWIQSAGNNAEDHWSGVLRDADADGYLDMPDPFIEQPYRTSNEVDATGLDPLASADVVMTWDQWPSSSLPITLIVQEYAPDPSDPSGANQLPVGDPMQTSQAPGDPVLDIHLQNTSTTEAHSYDVWVVLGAGIPALRYDLFYDGEAAPSYLAHADPAKGAAGSVSQPATSPYALAAGAADWRDNTLESFSGRGPTIDGRVKPDLLGYDGVSSNITDIESARYGSDGQPLAGTTGFYGTSAGAPHVTGAAALVAAANPAMDASDIEAFLESRANDGNAANPPVNGAGHGLLTLGSTDPGLVQPVAGSAYFPLSTPARIVDTRSGLGVRKGPMLAGTELGVTVPNSLDGQDLSQATSVVVEVSGTATKGGTFLSVYSSSFGGNATLPLTVQEPNATVTSIVRLNSGHGFKLRNQAAQTDALVTVIGYFGPAGGSGGLGYVPLTSHRLLDTRVPIGGPKGPLRPNQAVTVSATTGGVPATAAVAVVNITALNHKAGGYLTAYPAASPAVASVNYAVLSRPNLSLVPLVNGRFILQNRVATTDAMVDVVGYFSDSAAARYVSLPAPIRIADTRSGNGGQHGLLHGGTAFDLDAGGLYGVPYEVSGLWVGMTAIGVVPNYLAGAGYLTIYPNGTAQPHASNLDFTGSRSILNNGIATLSARTSSLPPGFSTADTGAGANVIEDAYGYFVTPGS
ncbi:MAG: S8 family serine peptidase [Jatrophihabitantaceae bacterium]